MAGARMSIMEAENDELTERIRELEAKIADLEARLPAHSLPPAMLEELEELEEELERLKKAASADQ